MAGVVTKDLIDISTADAATGWVGTSGQTDTEAFKQGTGAWTYQTPKNGIGNGNFTPAANINMTANYTIPHLYWTMRCDVFPFCEAVNTGATNSGLMVKVSDGSGNFVQWHIAGSSGTAGDQKIWDGSWRNFILDLTNTTDIHSSSGTLSLADVALIEWITDNSNSGTIRIIDNTWLDAVRYGDGLISNSLTTEAFSFQDIADDDFLTTNYYGVIQEKDGVLFAQGKLEIGKAATTTNFVSSGETVYFLERIVSASHHAIVGVPGTVTDVDITGLVCKTVGATGAEFDFSDATLDSFSLSSSVLIGMGVISFGLGTVDKTTFSSSGTTAVANCIVTGSSWISSGAITLTGTSTLTDCDITTSAATSAVLVSDLGDLITTHFIGDNTGHAVELSSVGGGSMTWSNTFDTTTYATVNGSIGNETIYVNVASGTLTINVSAGATTPTIRTAGAVVTVVSSVDYQLTGLDTGADVTIVDITVPATPVELFNEVAGVDGIVTYAFDGALSGTAIGVYLRNTAIKNNEFDDVLPVADKSFSPSQNDDNVYLP